MSHIVLHNDFHPVELDKVMQDLKDKNIMDATIMHGNNCIWVSYLSRSSRINAYYRFDSNHNLFDIQID